MLDRLPAVYADDDLAARFTAGLDDVLAPALSTLDNLWAYLDPSLCPSDFLDWLADWVGVDLAPESSDAVRRRQVARAAGWHRRRGTAAGLSEQLSQTVGCAVTVDDGCTVTWATTPGDPSPPEPARVRVTIHADPHEVDADAALALVRDAVPAHVVPVLEVAP
jgi:phage tail-like protein